jgi:predicted dehydrogenase
MSKTPSTSLPSRRDILRGAAAGTAVAVLGSGALANAQEGSARTPKLGPGPKDDFAVAPLKTVRCGFIGMGARGPSHLSAILKIEGAEVVSICDTHGPSREKGAAMTTKAGKPAPKLYGTDSYDYRRMLDEGNLDVVFISTPWEWHVPMAVDAMERGVHALIEVPAAITVDGCWELVETSERTKRHCMMLENVNYGREELAVLNMCRLGVFGELLHGEAAYIHDLRWQMKEIEHGTGSWRTAHYAKRNGNLYPTHGLGPICHYMNVNRGDVMDFMSSVSCNARSRELYAKEHFPEGHARRKLEFVCGDMNTTILRTKMGRTMMIQWDEQLPRPYSRHNYIQGTKGAFAGFPNRAALEEKVGDEKADSWMGAPELKALVDKYDHPLWLKIADMAKQHGGHGGMDFVMVWRIIYCLRNGLPLDQDVYDAASWSVISPLSELSVAKRGRSVDIPDFTRGAWKVRKSTDLKN